VSETIYRKYRPKDFQEVLGQKHVTQTLINELKNRRVSHAYLFSGPRGIGKTSIARILAKAVNCLRPKGGNPCNKCKICKAVNEGNLLDLIEIDAASTRGIDDIRELREKIKFPPSLSQYKVFIIDEVHMLTKEAFNALLKSLEEPPPRVIFIMCTTEIHRLPATIISRCQRFDFKKFTIEELTKRLKKITKLEKARISDKALKFISAHADGCARDAESLLQKVISLGDKNISLRETKEILGIAGTENIANFVDLVLSQKAIEAIQLVNRTLFSGFDLEVFSRQLQEYLRKILLIKLYFPQGSIKNSSLRKTSDFAEFSDEDLKKLIKQSQNFSSAKGAANFIQKISESQNDFKNPEIPQLPLEMLVVSLCKKTLPQTQKSVSPPVAIQKHTFVQPKPKITKKKSVEEEFSEILDQEESEENPKTTKKVDSVSKSEATVSKKEITNKVKTTIKIKDIRDHWPEIIDKTRTYNHSVAIFLKICNPLEIKGNKVILGCKYEFHKEKLRETKNREIIQKVLDEILSEKLSVDLKLDTDSKPLLKENQSSQKNSKKLDGLTKDALEIFGGKVVQN